MADQSLINRAVQSADQYPEFRKLLTYLIGSGGNIPVAVDNLDSSANAEFIVPGYGEKRYTQPSIVMDRFQSALSTKPELAATLIHEMTHAAQYRMNTQADKGSNNQFKDAYKKLYGGEDAKSQQQRPGPQLASKMDSNFTSTEQGYRSTPWELTAYGLGNSVTGTRNNPAPNHVDATLATEFMLLLDLATRGLKSN